MLDLINYVLATSSNVPEALVNLNKFQIVESAVYLSGKYHVYPLHYYIKDKNGDGAIIEFIKEKKIVHRGEDINVMTNSPDYLWQMKNSTKSQSQFHSNNTDYKVDGIYANGSGYKGLPGDYMPQSRFVKIKTLLDALPTSYSDISSSYGLNMALNSMIVPIGMNPAPTLWYSEYDLKRGDYQITTLISFAFDDVFQLKGNKEKPLDNIKTLNYNISSLSNIKYRAIVSYPKNINKDPSKIVRAKGPKDDTTYIARYGPASQGEVE